MSNNNWNRPRTNQSSSMQKNEEVYDDVSPMGHITDEMIGKI